MSQEDSDWPGGDAVRDAAEDGDPEPVYATASLVDVLLELAADADPNGVSIALAASRAADFDGDLDLPPETPVFTDFYLPGAGDAVSEVFGMDLGVPAGQTAGRFLSHPRGDLSVSTTDDFHARMLVAVPPWRREDVAAFDRGGRRHPLELLAIAPPAEPFDHDVPGEGAGPDVGSTSGE